MATTTKSKTSSTKKTASRTTTRKTPAKAASTRTAPAKAAASALLPDPVNTVVPTVVTSSQPTVTEPDLKKKELIELTVERSGVKKKYAKPAIEAALAILGETLAEGREMNLPPMGKIRINRNEEKADGHVVVCRLRRPKSRDDDAAAGAESGAETERKDPLAEPAE